jgi:methylmalonyl-CoA mutase cobalamin-binding subunit
MRDLVASALALARALDSSGLDDALRRAASTMGVPAFIETVVAPLLRRVGDEWHAGRVTVAQEHLVSSLVHDIVAENMRSFAARSGGPRVLVATLAGERHAIGTALVGAAAAADGWNVLYLGPDLPATEIADAAAAAGVRVVAVSIVYVEQQRTVIDELRTLRSRLPHPSHSSPVVAGPPPSVRSSRRSACEWNPTSRDCSPSFVASEAPHDGHGRTSIEPAACLGYWRHRLHRRPPASRTS